MTLSQDFIKQLLKDDKKPTGSNYPRVQQNGPLRFVDKEFRCASKGCACPTYIKVDWIPRCQIHALHILNQMVIDLTTRLYPTIGGSTMNANDEQGTNDETESGNAGTTENQDNDVEREKVVTGNQSDEKVAEILENEDDGA